MPVKQPWEVFLDALREQLSRHDVEPGSSGMMRKVPEVDVPRMSTAMANVLIEHLTSAAGLGQDEALEVAERFFAELGRQTKEPLEPRLKRAWEAWAESRSG